MKNEETAHIRVTTITSGYRSFFNALVEADDRKVTITELREDGEVNSITRIRKDDIITFRRWPMIKDHRSRIST